MNEFTNAKWIWLEGYDIKNAYILFKESVELEDVSGVQLNISADTNYACYINGVMAASGQYFDYEFDKVYDKVDISSYCNVGVNDIVIEAYHQGDDCFSVRNEKAGIIYSVMQKDKLLCSSGEKTVAAADLRYQFGGIEWCSPQLGPTFNVDLTKTSGQYAPVAVVDKKYPVRIRPIKKLVVGDNEKAYLVMRGGIYNTPKEGTTAQRMQYCALKFADPNVYQLMDGVNPIAIGADDDSEGCFAIIDTKRENAGMLSFDIEVDEECEMFVGWGEHLEDLRVRAFIGGRNFASRIVLANGRNVFVNPFRRLGMRYLEIHIYTKSAKVYYAGIKTTDYPVTADVSFSCADALHTRIYEVCKRTLLMCMHEHYEDCPWREQGLYTMDSRNQMLCGYYTFREYDFAKASLRLAGQSLREDGTLELCSPSHIGITIPSFSAIYLTQLAEYVAHSGDIEFANEMLPVAIKIADMFISRIDPDKGLIPVFKEGQYWNFYEWQDGLSGGYGVPDEKSITYDAPINAFVSFGLKSLCYLIDVTNYGGDFCADEYMKYDDARVLINNSIENTFWNNEKGAYCSYMNYYGDKYHFCELTNALILYTETEDTAQIIKARHDRARIALTNDSLIPVTLSHSIFKYEALLGKPCADKPCFEADEAKLAKYGRYVFGDIARQWGYMLSKDATTFWETIDGEAAFGNAGSLCHGWSAIPSYIYHRYAVGQNPEYTGLYECKVK